MSPAAPRRKEASRLLGTAALVLTLVFGTGVLLSWLDLFQGSIDLTGKVTLHPSTQPMAFGLFLVASAVLLFLATALGLLIVMAAMGRGQFFLLAATIFGILGAVTIGVGWLAVPPGSDLPHLLFFNFIGAGILGFGLLMATGGRRSGRKRR